MASPRVSVIIVSYNRLELLKRAIDSALAQTLTDREIIVIDNCSSFDVFDALADYGDRIRVIRNTGNFGCGNARNVAVKEAKGEFVAFLDDDDHWKPEKLQKQLDAIGDCVMAVCGLDFIPKGGRWIKNTTRVTPKMLRFGNSICGPSGFFCRRSLFDRISFDESLRYSEDWDFMVRACALGEIAYVPEALVWYTLNTSGASMTSQSRSLSWDEMQYRFVATEKHRDFLGPFLYRRRIAKIALSYVAARPDKVDFIRKSIRRVGAVATGLALGEAAAGKVAGGVRRLARIRPA